MLLTLNSTIGGAPTNYQSKILACVMPTMARNFTPKIHAIVSKGRFKPGDTLDMFMDTKVNNTPFNTGVCDKVISVQKFEVKTFAPDLVQYLIDGVQIDESQLAALSKNEGFDDLEDFTSFYSKPCSGQIVHWTDFKY